MKYLTLVPDGMADRPLSALGGRTPMETARKPCMDRLARMSTVGTVLHVPAGMVPESDTANMSILSFDPAIYSRGRSPLEAASMGIEMAPEDTAYRCNLVTLSEEGGYESKIMLDHSADEITTEEADILIGALDSQFGGPKVKFYTGVSYRHCLIIKDGNDKYEFMRPHDIIGRPIGEYLPRECDGGREFLELMRKSYEVLYDHAVNRSRRARGLRPANSAWVWSPGKKPQLPSFTEKWNLRAAVISAVDLIKGIGLCAGMTPISVPGATGNIHTNFEGKAKAAIKAFRDGYDFVFVHIEAPDECGHRAETQNKIRSIEIIDDMVLRPIYEYLQGCGDEYKILVLPDHPTPIETRTHSSEPIPFFLYSSAKKANGVPAFTEEAARQTGLYIPKGHHLLDMVIKNKTR
jgi:2,3-bisphosphoglycerate-independent phosphoglycerate mutase